MSAGNRKQNIPQVAAPVVDPNTGTVNPVWFDFFTTLYNRTGAALGNDSYLYPYPATTGTLGQTMTTSGDSSTPGTWVPAIKAVSQLTNDLNYLTASTVLPVISTQITAALVPYVKTTTLTTTLASYVTITSLGTTLLGYVTTATLASTLASYTTTAALTTALTPYATTASVTSTLASYATSASVTASLANYPLSSSFSGVNGNPGYYILPNSMKVAYGSSVITLSGTTGTITYGYTFPTAIYTLVICNGDGAVNSPCYVTGTLGLSSSTFTAPTATPGSLYRVNWTAYGR